MTAKAASTGKPTPPRGILVIGGGVAGIQAALDLGKAGARVYLVERTPSVGGRMALHNKFGQKANVGLGGFLLLQAFKPLILNERSRAF